MPYIEQKEREKLISSLNEVGCKCDNAGELNYCFTVIAQTYIQRKGLKYQHINDVIGALEGAKLELYRRVASPYENKKIDENGDVFLVEGLDENKS